MAKVAPGLLRGGQPLDASVWRYLQSIGYSNVVKLNTEREGSDDEARRLGMHVTYLPITLCQQLEGGPSFRTVAKAVAIMSQPGTFVHCSHGQDRTGEIVGVYRVWIQHWSPQDAYAEMKAHKFHPLIKGLYDSYWECVK